MKIKHVSWRNGRPRFNPPESLRRKGHKGHDLKIDGRWMTKGEAFDWSDNFERQLKAEKVAAQKARAAERQKAERERDHAVARLPAATRRRSYTLGQMLEDHLEHGTDENARATRKFYLQLRKMIEEEEPIAYAAEATAITRPMIYGIYDNLKRRRGVAMSYHGIRYICTVYNWALDRPKGINANPAVKIKTVKPKPRVKMLGVAEYLHWIAVADGMGYGDVGDMICWGVFSCQRTGDRLAMLKSDIIDGRLEIVQQKTEAEVKVRLARQILKRQAARPAHKAKTIIAHEDTGNPMPYATYNGRFQRVRAAAAVDMPSIAGFNDQDLRDTSASWMTRAGCTDAEIMSVSGHGRSTKTRILDHYQLIDTTVSDAAITKLETWFDKEVKKLKGKKR